MSKSSKSLKIDLVQLEIGPDRFPKQRVREIKIYCY